MGGDVRGWGTRDKRRSIDFILTVGVKVSEERAGKKRGRK